MKHQCLLSVGRLHSRALWANNLNNNSALNGNNNLNYNNYRVSGIALLRSGALLTQMKTYNRLFEQLCSIENLELAFKKARKHKTLKPYVLLFEKNLAENLQMLHTELIEKIYAPLPLNEFILRDPKTRRISVSDFRDRVVHHAICNILEPIFEKYFIYDSYANRKGKGNLKAIERFDYFKRKVSCNGRKLSACRMIIMCRAMRLRQI